jgi:RNA polymerase sigma factor (sigma-70 family)
MTTQNMDEAALIQSARKGDLDSFNSLVLVYQHQVYNLAYRIMGDEAPAADATQNAFISAYKNLKSFRGGSFKSWLLRIVTNACYDDLRRKKRRPAVSLDELMNNEDTDVEYDVPSGEDGPETIAQRHELVDLIQSGITTLPEDQRITLVLSDVQGLSYEEIADMTRTNLGTVKSRLSRGRAKLREYLQLHGELLPEAYRLESDQV